MAGMDVRISGVAAFRASLAEAQTRLSDLGDAAQKTAAMITAAAAARAPRRTGRLAASGRPSASAGRATVQFGSPAVPYAGVVHWGWPRHGIAPDTFASDAAQATEASWLPLYEADAQAALDGVHGA